MRILRLSIFALALAASTLYAADPISATDATGRVTYAASASGPAQPLSSTTRFNIGGRLRTGANGSVIMSLPGNSRLKLMPNSDVAIEALPPVGPIEPTASFVPVGSAIKSVLTHTDSEPHPDLAKPIAIVSLKSGSVVATVENTDFKVNFATATISTSNAWVAITAQSTGFARISVTRGAVTVTRPHVGAVEIPAGQFAELERQPTGSFALSGPTPGETNPAAQQDLLALQSGAGILEPVAEKGAPSDGKEVINDGKEVLNDGKQVMNDKEVLPPVAELLPPAGVAAEPGAVGTGLSNPFDLVSQPNPRNTNRNSPVSPVNP